MTENSYELYQLKNEDSTRERRFMGMSYLKKIGASVQREQYDLVYHAPMEGMETLDSIYEKFNLHHPADFRGHSLSVSDVVVFHKDGTDKAYYVDSFGFAEVPEFLAEQNREHLITMSSKGISVQQHMGTWFPVEQQAIEGKTFFLLEHETYGSDVASVVVDEQGNLYAQEVYNGFSQDVVELIRAETAPVEVLPDPSVSVQDMERYGYGYMGMLPVGADVATAHFYNGTMMVYALHPDGTDTVIGNEHQLQHHIDNGGMFAVEKQDWMRYLENGEYLRTAEISEEQNYDMIDGRMNNQKTREDNPKAKPSLLGRLQEKKGMLSQKENKENQEQDKKKEMAMQ